MSEHFCWCLFLWPHFPCMSLHTCYLVGLLTLCMCAGICACMWRLPITIDVSSMTIEAGSITDL